MRELQPGIAVRTGLGTVTLDGTFTDEVGRIDRRPRPHRGWRSVRFKGRRYQLFGGCHVDCFICLSTPIPTKAERAAAEEKRIRQVLAG